MTGFTAMQSGDIIIFTGELLMCVREGLPGIECLVSKVEARLFYVCAKGCDTSGLCGVIKHERSEFDGYAAIGVR